MKKILFFCCIVVGVVQCDSEVWGNDDVRGHSAYIVHPASGRTASRALPSNAVTNSGTRGATGRNTVAARTTVADTARTARLTTANISQRGTTSRNAARSGSANQIATTRRQMQATSKPGVAARASIVQTDTVNTPLYTGRVAMRASAARARISSVSSLGGGTTSSETIASMDKLAQMTDFCKVQYTQCMDNFCNVLDDNQGRCSCSKNLKNYAKTEDALKKATEDLQDVAQLIQYIGLTGDEINTLFSQTEAEQTMQSKTDNTQLKNSLDSIRRLIVDVKSGTATSADTGLNFDMSGLLDFSVDSAGFDLASLFGNQTETASISNQRGEQLYKTAAARCKASVLTSCQSQGVDISLITNSYDLEIDKQCIAYERELTDANDEMVQTVRNAKGVLQRARLMVARQKSAYDLRGCVNALDACMQDDYVCGSDYENCLDPTGKYIVNGEIVVGSTPGHTVASATNADSYSKDTLYGTWVYNNGAKYAWGASASEGNLGDYIEKTVDGTPQSKNSSLMSEYLLYKIGYNSGGKNYGMCISVLNKCQDYTYENGNYKPDNVVVKQYLDRTMTRIKAQQDAVVASHAEKCITDVTSCLSTNGYEGKTYVPSANDKVALNVCRAQISTCMSVNGAADSGVTDIETWVKSWYGSVDDLKNIRAEQCKIANGIYDAHSEKCRCVSGNKQWEITLGVESCECEEGYKRQENNIYGVCLPTAPECAGVLVSMVSENAQNVFFCEDGKGHQWRFKMISLLAEVASSMLNMRSDDYGVVVYDSSEGYGWENISNMNLLFKDTCIKHGGSGGESGAAAFWDWGSLGYEHNGACVICTAPNTVPASDRPSQCQCKDGYVDANGDKTDGCEKAE